LCCDFYHDSIIWQFYWSLAVHYPFCCMVLCAFWMSQLVFAVLRMRVHYCLLNVEHC
jgi:hypothetical protein